MDLNLRTPKGRRLQRRCFGRLHTCRYWKRKPELHRRPSAYEADELLLLHPALVRGFNSLAWRQYVRARQKFGGALRNRTPVLTDPTVFKTVRRPFTGTVRVGRRGRIRTRCLSLRRRALCSNELRDVIARCSAWRSPFGGCPVI
jgi:hypothetical protein